MNRSFVIIITILLLSFQVNKPLYALGYNDTRMEYSTGEESGGGGGSSVQRTNRSLLEALQLLFSGSSASDTTTPSSNTDVSPNSGGDSSNSTSVNNFNDIASDITDLLNNNGITYPASITAAAQNCLKNIGIYKQVQSSQGIPWQILAGIHYREGGCNSNQSPVGGRVIGQAEPDVKSCSSQENGLGKPKALKQGGCGFDNLLDATTYAALHLKGKIGGIPQSHADLVKALSKFNGGGNSNCRGGTNYAHCPPPGPGFDDAYVFSKNPDGKNENMWLRFCGDGRKCNPPQVFSGIGVIPIAGAINELAGQDI